jgi:hypothetical protein
MVCQESSWWRTGGQALNVIQLKRMIVDLSISSG